MPNIHSTRVRDILRLRFSQVYDHVISRPGYMTQYFRTEMTPANKRLYWKKFIKGLKTRTGRLLAGQSAPTIDDLLSLPQDKVLAVAVYFKLAEALGPDGSDDSDEEEVEAEDTEEEVEEDKHLLSVGYCGSSGAQRMSMTGPWGVELRFRQHTSDFDNGSLGNDGPFNKAVRGNEHRYELHLIPLWLDHTHYDEWDEAYLLDMTSTNHIIEAILQAWLQTSDVTHVNCAIWPIGTVSYRAGNHSVPVGESNPILRGEGILREGNTKLAYDKQWHYDYQARANAGELTGAEEKIRTEKRARKAVTDHVRKSVERAEEKLKVLTEEEEKIKAKARAHKTNLQNIRRAKNGRKSEYVKRT